MNSYTVYHHPRDLSHCARVFKATVIYTKVFQIFDIITRQSYGLTIDELIGLSHQSQLPSLYIV
jgi:hypothetical protein